MSGFMHRDRYKLRDGTVVESVKAKYNCFQRAQKLRDCDGQALYLADRVDGIVLEAVRELFAAIQRAPRDKVLEQRIRQDNQGRKRQKEALEKELRECEHALERYESEVLRCIDGKSSFSQEMLARLISKAESELYIARQKYAKTMAQIEDEAETAKRIKEYYLQFCGWAEEFEMASTARKRVILSELLEKVEVGKGYQVTIRLKMSYQQFLDLCAPEDQPKNTLTKSHDEEVA